MTPACKLGVSLNTERVKKRQLSGNHTITFIYKLRDIKAIWDGDNEIIQAAIATV